MKHVCNLGRSTQALWGRLITSSDTETNEIIIASNKGVETEMKEDEY